MVSVGPTMSRMDADLLAVKFAVHGPCVVNLLFIIMGMALACRSRVNLEDRCSPQKQWE